MATKAQRHHMLALMDMLVHYEPQVHYPPGDVRTSFDNTTFRLSEHELEQLLKAGKGVRADCSEIVTEICRWAGLKDPNNLGWRWPGYTGTLLASPLMRHYTDPAKANVGAIVIFGGGTGEHAAMVHTPGKDPVLFSHGQERGPILIRLSDEKRYHADQPVTLLAISSL